MDTPRALDREGTSGASASAVSGGIGSMALTIPTRSRGHKRSFSDETFGVPSGALMQRQTVGGLVPKGGTLKVGTVVQGHSIEVAKGGTNVTVAEGGTLNLHNHHHYGAEQTTAKVNRPPLYACVINPAMGWLIMCGSLLRLNYYDGHQLIKTGLIYLVDQKLITPFVKIGGIGMDTEGLGDFVAWGVLWIMVVTCTYSALKNFVFGISSYLFLGKTK